MFLLRLLPPLHSFCLCGLDVVWTTLVMLSMISLSFQNGFNVDSTPENENENQFVDLDFEASS